MIRTYLTLLGLKKLRAGPKAAHIWKDFRQSTD